MLNSSRSLAFEMASILAQHKAENVVVLDLRGVSGWTDFFVIGTCTSSTHMRGLARSIEDSMSVENAQSLNKPGISNDESWYLQDLGDVVVHIMSAEARGFYELEKLWFKASAFKVEAGLTNASAGIAQAAKAFA